MRLWTYQHPNVLLTLKKGERYTCAWEHVPGDRWQNAFRFMCQQMAERDIPIGEHAPVWTWHTVYRLGGMPDDDWANGLLFAYQLAQGIDLLQLEVPDSMALVSNYGAWCEVLDRFIDGQLPQPSDVSACFSVQLSPKRGRPPAYFPSMQACLPYIEPEWLVAQLPFDAQKMLEQRAAAIAAFKARLKI